MKSSIHAGLTTLVVAMAFTSMTDVSAEEYHQNATGVCQSNLPASDTNIRKRPTAIRNEGTGSAFVSCSTMNLLGNEVTTVGIRINNAGATPATINCTMVNGRQSFAPTFFPKSAIFAPGGNNFIIWTAAADNGGVNFDDLINFSCTLLPQTDIEYTAVVTVDPL